MYTTVIVQACFITLLTVEDMIFHLEAKKPSIQKSFSGGAGDGCSGTEYLSCLYKVYDRK